MSMYFRGFRRYRINRIELNRIYYALTSLRTETVHVLFASAHPTCVPVARLLEEIVNLWLKFWNDGTAAIMILVEITLNMNPNM